MASQIDVSDQNWQVPCKEMKQRGVHLLRTGLFSDCKFLVGSERIPFNAHRLILAMASPVFAAMFYGPKAKDNVSITNVSPEIFQCLLKYIYTDEIEINSFSDACDLLCIAHRYMLQHVVKACTLYMTSNLSPDNTCRVYEVARLFDETELMDVALRMMSTNTKEVLTSDTFDEADLSTVVKLFSLDQLNIDSELDLLNAAERYVQVHKNLVPELEGNDELSIRSAVQHVRFLTMTPEQFAENKTTFLTVSEGFAILKNIISKDANSPMPMGFSNSRELRKVRGIGDLEGIRWFDIDVTKERTSVFFDIYIRHMHLYCEAYSVLGDNDEVSIEVIYDYEKLERQDEEYDSDDATNLDWQAPYAKVQQRCAHLLSTGLWSDCTFLVGLEKIAIPAHRLILAMASSVFEAMFYGPMAEHSNCISLPDVQPAIFRSLLVYIYSDEIQISSFEDACDLLCVAHKYMLQYVVDSCNAYISLNISPQNVCQVYELARLYDNTELMENAIMVMSAETKEVLKSKYFEEAELSTVVKLFALHELNISSEIDLLEAAERYARGAKYAKYTQEGSEKLTIRCAVKQIRFLTLTLEQFTEQDTAFLTDSESFAILKNIFSKNTQYAMPEEFSTSREIRTRGWSRSILEGTCWKTIGFMEEVTYPNPFYVRDMLCYVKVDTNEVDNSTKKFTVYFGVDLGNCVETNSAGSQSCIVIIEIIVPSSDNTGNIVAISSEPIELSNSSFNFYHKVADFNFKGIVMIELRVHSFPSMVDAQIAASTSRKLRE